MSRSTNRNSRSLALRRLPGEIGWGGHSCTSVLAENQADIAGHFLALSNQLTRPSTSTVLNAVNTPTPGSDCTAARWTEGGW